MNNYLSDLESLIQCRGEHQYQTHVNFVQQQDGYDLVAIW